jgi:type IV secretory pathway TrbL component
MNRRTEEEAVIIILVVFILVPFGLILLSFPAQPHYMVSGEPVREAAKAVGITIENVTNTTWPLPGAIGGRSYTLADQAGNSVIVQTQSFASAQSRDAAIQTFAAQSVGKGRPIETLLVIGNHLIVIGPDPGGILNRIGPELKKKQNAFMANQTSSPFS